MTKKQLSGGWIFWPIFSLGMSHLGAARVWPDLWERGTAGTQLAPTCTHASSMLSWHILPSPCPGAKPQSWNWQKRREEESALSGCGRHGNALAGTVPLWLAPGYAAEQGGAAHPAYPAKPRGKREGRVSGTLGIYCNQMHNPLKQMHNPLKCTLYNSLVN